MLLWELARLLFFYPAWNLIGWPHASKFTTVSRFSLSMDLETTVDYLAEELDLERSEHVREVGRSVGKLRD